ncbi:methylornithine synthase PylB [Deltaproteobacteria bacterium OttesenSCG-928-M10]|nr:methylornithine synthase PylB [Deltaproteobacteria bacterium OttesenSCG-928-M10]
MSLDGILNKALEGRKLERDDLVGLLTPADDDQRSAIRAAARQMRGQTTGRLVFTYGFVYLSTYCRNDCRFCSYRRTNGQALRYRKSAGEVTAASNLLAAQGVNLIDLTMGEDPATDRNDYIDEISAMIREVKAETGLPVMISPGVASREALRKYRAAGADWYACYQETHNPDLFARLRQGQDFQARWQSKREAMECGLLVEEGALCGVGETAGDLADSILAMADLGAAQVRAMGFVPPAEAEQDSGGRWVDSPSPGSAQSREIDMIAALRLARPECLIPASLDVEGLAGLATRLDAGANLITSLVPAGLSLAGVAQASLDIDNEARSIPGARPVVEGKGLKLASAEEYGGWLARARA